MEDRYRYRRPRERSRAGIYFARSLELLAIALAYLEKSRLVRFITAKLSMSAVVEVTARFGRNAGHRLSTFLSLIVAEPRLLAVIITGILLIVNLVVWLVGLIQNQQRRRRYSRRTMPPYSQAEAGAYSYSAHMADADAFRMAEPAEPHQADRPSERKSSSTPYNLSGLLFILCLALVSALFFCLGV